MGSTSFRFTAATSARSALHEASAACGTCVSDFTLIGCDSDCCRSIAWLQDLAQPPLALSRLVIRSQSQIPLELLYPAVFGQIAHLELVLGCGCPFELYKKDHDVLLVSASLVDLDFLEGKLRQLVLLSITNSRNEI
jgi:hypothetical protein